MCDEDFDIKRCIAVPNPFADRLGKQVTLGLAYSDIEYFKRIGDKLGLCAEHVMEIYLRSIVHTGYEINIDIPRLDVDMAPAAIGDIL